MGPRLGQSLQRDQCRNFRRRLTGLKTSCTRSRRSSRPSLRSWNRLSPRCPDTKPGAGETAASSVYYVLTHSTPHYCTSKPQELIKCINVFVVAFLYCSSCLVRSNIHIC